MNKKYLLITTTSNLQGWEIKKYYGIVSYQLVIGANIFRDVFASFRDIFGGISKGYQKDLENMKKIAFENIQKQAKQEGANAIVGLKIDFDEISGGKKSMFMLSVIGTAVYAVNEKTKDNSPIISKIVTREEVEYKLGRNKIKKLIDSGEINIYRELINKKLIDYKISAISEILKYLDDNPLVYESLSDILFEYFQNIPFQKINEYFQDDTKYPIKLDTLRKFIKILDYIKWYNLDIIIFLLYSKNIYENLYALFLLRLDKEVYEFEDIDKYKLIIKKLENIDSIFPLKKVIKGAFGKEKNKWICFNCETLNDVSLTQCSKCWSTIYGTKQSEPNPKRLQVIIQNKIDILTDCFNKKST